MTARAPQHCFECCKSDLASQGYNFGQNTAISTVRCRSCCSQEYSAVYVASQGLEQLLELMANDGDTRPLVVTSRDRLDIVMGLLASQVGSLGLYALAQSRQR